MFLNKKTKNTRKSSTVSLLLLSLFILCIMAGWLTVAVGDDTTLSDNETAFDALGINTSEMPESYDEDSTENPLGADTHIVAPMQELITFSTIDAQDQPNNYTNKRLGHNLPLDGKFNNFLNSARSSGENWKIWSKLNNDRFYAFEAGAFTKGDIRKNMIAMIEQDWDYNFSIRIYDPATDSIGYRRDLDAPRPAQRPGDWAHHYRQSLMSISTGDYDGDGVDEIAVFRPSFYANNNNALPSVVIFDHIGNSPLYDQWKIVWSYTLNPTGNSELVNNVDLASGDVDQDGTSDLIISYGNSYKTRGDIEYKPGDITASKSVLLFGDKNGEMLRRSKAIKYTGMNEDLASGDSKLIRVAFEFGDINGDGSDEIIMGGQRYNDAINYATRNHTRVLGIYQYDEVKKEITPTIMKNMQVIEGYGGGGDFRSANGYDNNYLSLPSLKANLAITNLYGTGSNPLIYMDSVLYSYDKDFHIVDELEDQSKGISPYAGYPYVEYDAIGANFTGANFGYVFNHRISENNSGGNQRRDAGVFYKDDPKSGLRFSLLSQMDYGRNNGGAFGMSAVNTDIDSSTMKYTGEHSIQFTSPKVLAVLASSPYFKDVAESVEGGEGILDFSETNYGTSTGGGTGEELSNSYSIGAAVSVSLETPAVAFDIDVAIGRVFDYARSKTDTTEFSVSYGTAAGENQVVFYSIPTECYVYEVESVTVNDKGQPVKTKAKQVISIPHQPATSTLPLDEYEKIRVGFRELPQIRDSILNVVPGEPESYPSSASGFEKPLVYNGDWAGVGFGNGYISQAVSESQEESEGWSYGNFVDISAVFGTEYVKGGGTFSGSHTDGKIDIRSSGSGFDGQIVNMPKEVKDYGYYFAWKVFRYIGQTENGQEFPVVSYLVRDVTAPPSLPEDFTQDYEATTEHQIGLEWEYNKSVQNFDLYRTYPFPIGGGERHIATIKGNSFKLLRDRDGNIIYDEQGNPTKVFTYTDNNLESYTDYTYRLQVNRVTAPPKSILTRPLVAKTKAPIHPNLKLSTDELALYPDLVQSVDITIENKDQFVDKSDNYQWQKINERTWVWEDIPNTTSTLQFKSSSFKDEGTYRCRVNIIANKETSGQYYISEFSDELTTKFSKREMQFGAIDVEEVNANTDIISVPVNNSNDGTTAKPTGTVKFRIYKGSDTFVQTTKIDSQTNTAKVLINSLPKGAYSIMVEYMGNKIFEAKPGDEIFHFLKGINVATYLDLDRSYKFGADISKSYKLMEYSREADGSISGKDITKKITKIIFSHPVGLHDIATYDITKGEKPLVPLSTYISPELLKAYVKAYTAESDMHVAGKEIALLKLKATLTVKEKKYTAGVNAKPPTRDDLVLEGEGSLTGPLDLSNLYSTFKTKDGQELFNNLGNVDMSKLQPGEYFVEPKFYIKTREIADKFYDLTIKDGSYVLLGSYHDISVVAEKYIGAYAGQIDLIAPQEIEDVKNIKYPNGAELLFRADPTNGYYVKQWKVTEEGNAPVYFDNLVNTLRYTVESNAPNGSSKIEVCAIFSPRMSTLYYAGLGEGTVTCESGVSSGTVILTGQKLDFVAQPKDGYDLLEWRWINIGSGTTVRKVTDAQRAKAEEDRLLEGPTALAKYRTSFNMQDSPAQVYAVFERKPMGITLGANINAYYINDGKINPSYKVGKEVLIDNTSQAPMGATIVLKPKPGYEVSGEWKVEAIKPGQKVTITTKVYSGNSAVSFEMPKNTFDADSVAVTAKIIRGYYGINASAVDETAQISVAVNGVNKPDKRDWDLVEGGSAVSIKASAKRGYKFKSWQLNGEPSEVTNLNYVTNIVQNLNLKATCETLKNRQLTLATAGPGTAEYTINTPGGEIVKGTINSTPKTIPVYDGEKISVSTKPNKGNYASYQIVDGKRSVNTTGSFTINSVSKDQSIVMGFENAYFSAINFEATAAGQIKIYDAISGNEIKPSENKVIPSGQDYVFQLKDFAASGKVPVAYLDEKRLTATPVAGKADTYSFTITQVLSDREVHIYDAEMRWIRTADQLNDFFASIEKTDGNRLHAILKSDIALDSGFYAKKLSYLKGGSYDNSGYQGVFDGNGFKIHGVRYGGWGYSDSVYPGLFSIIGKNGVVKNLSIDDFKIRIKGIPAYRVESANYKPSDPDAANHSIEHTGILSSSNRGQVLNCQITNSTLDSKDGKSFGITVNNAYGIVKNCVVSNFRSAGLDGDYQGNSVADWGGFDHSGGGKGSIVNTYVYKNSNKDGKITSMAPIMGNQIYRGTYSGNLYDNANVTTREEVGDSVNAEGNNQGSGYWAMKLNDANKTPSNQNPRIWGITSNTADYPVPIDSARNASLTPEVPYKVTFGKVASYVYPKNVKVPTEAETGVKAWDAQGITYGAGTIIPVIHGELNFKPVIDFSIYKARLVSNTKTLNIYFKDVEQAFTLIEELRAQDTSDVELTIFGDCTISNTTLTIDSKTKVSVLNGAILTIAKDSTIKNSGKLVINGKAKIINYGMFQNLDYATLGIYEDKGFVNSGEFTSTNRAYINTRVNMECAPHSWGTWKITTQPTSETEGARHIKCNACDTLRTQVIAKNPVNPDPDDVNFIIISEPAKKEALDYEFYDKFSAEEMRITAYLTDGSTATVLNNPASPDDRLAFRIRVGSENLPITRFKTGEAGSGTTLAEVVDPNKPGNYQVTVDYAGKKAYYTIGVHSNLPGPTVELKDSGGTNVLTTPVALDVAGVNTVGIKATFASAPSDAVYTWEIADNTVAKITPNAGSEYSYSDVTLTGLSKGKTSITVRCSNHAALSTTFTVNVSNNAHATKVTVAPETLKLSKGNFAPLTAIMTPVENIDALVWVSATPAVASVTTWGTVTAISAGTAHVTAYACQALDPSMHMHGGSDLVYDTCVVTVPSKGTGITLDKTTSALKLGQGDSLTATIEGTSPEDDIIWTSSNTSILQVANVKLDLTDNNIQYADIIALKTTPVGQPVTVTAALASDPSKNATCAVTITHAATDVTIKGSTGQEIYTPYTIYMGDSGGDDKTLTAALTPGDATDKVLWLSSNPLVSTVSFGGESGNTKIAKLHPIKPGWTSITAITDGGQRDTIDVLVKQFASGIELSETTKTMAENDVVDVTAFLAPVDSIGMVTWSSSDSDIVAVTPKMLPGSYTTSDATLEAKAVGSATITAILGNPESPTAVKTIDVTVAATAQSAPMEITLDKSYLKLDKDSTQPDALAVTLTPAEATDVITWSIVENDVGAPVIENITHDLGDPYKRKATITTHAINSGYAKIIATTETGRKASCDIAINVPATKLELDKTEFTISPDKSARIIPLLTPTDSTDEIAWASSDTSVATVDNIGRVHAEKPGTVTITATASSFSSDSPDPNLTANCTVRVIVPAESVKLDSEEMKLGKGGSKFISASTDPKDTTDTFIWTSSDESILAATVETNALGEAQSTAKLNAVALGEAKVTITLCSDNNPSSHDHEGDIKAQCTVIVSEGASKVTLKYDGVEVGSGGILPQIFVPDIETEDKKLSAETTGQPDSIEWSSSDGSILNINSFGHFTPKKPGYVGILAETGSGMSDWTRANIRTLATGISIGSDIIGAQAIKVPLGSERELNATLTPATSEDYYEWSISDASKSIIELKDIEGSKDVMIIAKSVGEATITAKTEGITPEGGGDPTKVETDTRTIKVMARPSTITLADMAMKTTDDPKKMMMTLVPAGSFDEDIGWFSSDTKIAFVDEQGFVHANGPGQVDITASTLGSSGAIATTATVTINRPATDIQLDNIALFLVDDEIQNLVAEVTPADNSETVSWSSDAPTIAMVDNNGKVTAKKAGSATITATVKTENGDASAVCAVTVTAKIFTVQFKNGNQIVKTQNVARGSFASAPTLAVRKGYSYSWDKKFGNIQAALTVNAIWKEILPTKVVISGPKVVKRKKSITLKAAVSPSTALVKTVTWKSSNSKIAKINSKGKVTGIKKGKVTITATAKDGAKKTWKVTVKK